MKKKEVHRYGFRTTAGRDLFAYGADAYTARCIVIGALRTENGELVELIESWYNANAPWPVTLQEGRLAPGA